MATIGSLAVNITATTSQFSAGLDKARSKMKGFASSVTSQIGSLQTVIGTFVAGTAATFIKSTIDEASALQDAADKIGLNTEALQKLRFAAGQTGTSADALERSLTFLNKTMGNAMTGNQAAVDSFKLVGLSIDDIKGKSPDQVFNLIVDAINKLPTPAERTAAAVKLLGRSGAELLPMIQQGSAGIEKLGKDLEMMGGLIKGDTVKSLEELGDKIEAIMPTIKAISAEFVNAFGPAIQFFLDDIIFKLKLLNAAMEKLSIVLDKLKAVGNWVGIPGLEPAAAPTTNGGTANGGTANTQTAANADQKQVAKNTGTTNEKLDVLIDEIRQSRGAGVPLAPAGVR